MRAERHRGMRARGRGSGVEARPDKQGIVSETPFLFREVQRFRQWLFWLPIIAVTGVVWWQFAEQIVRGNPQGQQPIPDCFKLPL